MDSNEFAALCSLPYIKPNYARTEWVGREFHQELLLMFRRKQWKAKMSIQISSPNASTLDCAPRESDFSSLFGCLFCLALRCDGFTFGNFIRMARWGAYGLSWHALVGLSPGNYVCSSLPIVITIIKSRKALQSMDHAGDLLGWHSRVDFIYRILSPSSVCLLPKQLDHEFFNR